MLIIFLKTSYFFKLLEVLLVSGFKFIFAPLLSFKLGFSYFQTILFTSIGGLLGVIFFFYLSAAILSLFRKFWPLIKNYFFKQIQQKKIITYNKKFSFKNKFLVNARKKYGLWGIALLTPVLLSIPLGTFLANKYYKNKKTVLLSLIFSVFCWSIIISSVYAFFKITPFYFLH